MREAEKRLAEQVAATGYMRAELQEREDGFVVGYRGPDVGEVKTSFFSGSNTKFESSDATGIAQITWIMERR